MAERETKKAKVPFTRYAEEQYLTFARDLVDKYNTRSKQITWVAPIMTGVTGMFVAGFYNEPIVGAFLILVVGGGIVLLFQGQRQLELEANLRVADQLRKETEMIENNGNMHDRINIVAGSGSMVLVGSQARDLIMNIAGDDNELKDAMAKISTAIEALGNRDAADSWKDFLEEAAGKKSKSKLKAFWDRTVSLAPDIATLTAAVAKVAALMI